jgi:tRNA threonylcarbamoyladenosine biosynthesis protein TsaB
MKILGLEFSSGQRSVAVLVESVDGPRVLSEVVESGGHSTKGLPMIQEGLRQAGIEREEIERVAVGLGPGSYTGIRAAISLAQGWQLARNVSLLGISSADCLAAQARADGLRGKIGVVIDAQRNEFYLAGYELNDEGWIANQPLRLATPGEVKAFSDTGALLTGPEISRWFPANGRTLHPRAAMLVELAASRTDVVPGEKLEPVYLRETSFVKAPPARTW